MKRNIKAKHNLWGGHLQKIYPAVTCQELEAAKDKTGKVEPMHLFIYLLIYCVCVSPCMSVWDGLNYESLAGLELAS